MTTTVGAAAALVVALAAPPAAQEAALKASIGERRLVDAPPVAVPREGSLFPCRPPVRQTPRP